MVARSWSLWIFLVVSLIWGLTWIAIKVGIEATPPLFFAAARFVAAGGLLLLVMYRRIDWRGIVSHWQAVLAIAVLMTTLAYGLAFWGMQHTPSGVAAVVNLSMTPLALFVIGLALGAETFSKRKVIGVAIGLFGLLVLFWPELQSGKESEAAGLLALVSGTIVYSLASVLSRRWLTGLDIVSMSGAVMLIGGIGLALLSAVLEPLSAATVRALFQPAPLASWLFLIVCGSIVAFTLYLYLLRVWGPTRAGLYAFVSPIVALIAGAVVLGERIEPMQGVGACILIAAAAIGVGGNQRER